MKRVNITLKTEEGTDQIEFVQFLTKDYLTDAAILRYGFPMDTEFEFEQNGVVSNYKETALVLKENDTIELTVKK